MLEALDVETTPSSAHVLRCDFFRRLSNEPASHSKDLSFDRGYLTDVHTYPRVFLDEMRGDAYSRTDRPSWYPCLARLKTAMVKDSLNQRVLYGEKKTLDSRLCSSQERNAMSNENTVIARITLPLVSKYGLCRCRKLLSTADGADSRALMDKEGQTELT